ncbi:MAG: aspartyl protease family protein [Candidatus Omnitrophota bacterium]|jgi:clan AA aspartic protease (TIGR02281 family)
MRTRGLALAMLLAFALAVTPCFSSAASADTVYLKNKGVLKGVIKAEDSLRITLAIGTGTMKISRDQIESIEKASEAENAVIESSARKKAIERGTLVPEAFEDTAKQLKALVSARKAADDAKERLDEAKETLTAKKKKYKNLRSKFDDINKKVGGMDPQSDVRKYNLRITEMNALNTEVAAVVEDLNALSPKIPEYERTYWKAITEYGNNVGNFRLSFEKKVDDMKERGISDEEALYAGIAGKAISEIEKSLNRDSVSLTKTANGMTVKAVLNGSTSCLLAVDTGASIVVISKEVAKRIETNPNETIEDVNFTLADGSTTKSDVIIVKSIRVGNSTAYNVPVAVADNPPGHGIDGLLGMSFLGNFNIKMDVANEKLVLESIK